MFNFLISVLIDFPNYYNNNDLIYKKCYENCYSCSN